MTKTDGAQIRLPQALLDEIDTLAEGSIDKALWYATANRMIQLTEVLKPLIEEDEKLKEKDKEYILSFSFASFMYIMIAVSEYALSNNIEELNFKEVADLVQLLIKHQLVIDHPSFSQMLATLDTIRIEKIADDIKITMYTHAGKRAKAKFKKGIPSPRFVISSVIVENEATFVFSDFLAKKNQEEVEEFLEDSQKMFGVGGIVLMDDRKKNIPGFVEAYKQDLEAQAEPIKPMMVKGTGFHGTGYIRGIKLPSPAAGLDTIYLLPGRDGTPVFIRAKAFFIKPFVAL